jgi:transposase
LGRSQGGVSTKLHIRVDGQGQPIVFVLTPGERHESTAFDALLAGGRVKRAGRGRPKRRPKRLGGDKAYSNQHIRATLRRDKIGIVIPHPNNQRRRGPFNKAWYRQRNQVERCFNRLKQNRRVATRYEKRASMYCAVVTVAAIMLWL